MAEFEYDLFVIGAGSGGVRASRIAAGHGARVAVAEEYRVGGTCVIRGCVPKKLLVYASHFAEELHDAAGFGWTIGEMAFDWAKLRDFVASDVDRLERAYTSTLDSNKVTHFHERAVVTGPHGVRLASGREITARHILIAVGAWPVMPDFPGKEHAITSNEVFALATFPKRVVIQGAGYIALEFAGIFNALGDGSLRVHTAGHDPLIADAVMVATGRAPKTAGLGLESAGVMLGRNGAVPVDAHNATTCPSIHAVGDVTDRVQLTPVAIREGHAFADAVFGGNPRTIAYDHIPSAVFSQPPLAGVGLTEAQARAEGREIKIFTSDFRPMKNMFASRTERGFYKLIVDALSDKVIGVHMIGPEAPEICQAVAIAVKAGLAKADFDATVALHPSMAEELVLMK